MCTSAKNTLLHDRKTDRWSTIDAGLVNGLHFLEWPGYAYVSRNLENVSIYSAPSVPQSQLELPAPATPCIVLPAPKIPHRPSAPPQYTNTLHPAANKLKRARYTTWDPSMMPPPHKQPRTLDASPSPRPAPPVTPSPVAVHPVFSKNEIPQIPVNKLLQSWLPHTSANLSE